jgi:DNA repair protein RadC
MEVCLTLPKTPGPVIENSDDVCQLLQPVASKLPRESFYTICLNAGGRVIGIEEVQRGSVNDVTVHPREVFLGALLANAYQVIVAHNHPSTDTSPTPDDFDLTERLSDAGKLLGVPVLDHVILGTEDCVSIRERKPRLFSDDDDDFD